MASPVPLLVIEAGAVERRYWRDFWRYRELLYLLAWRDILVRYKQTAIGVAWALVRPAFAMVAFTLVFGRIAKLPSGGVPYPVLVYVAMLPWMFFAGAVSEASGSLVANAPLISKIYFPRLIIPASALATSFIDFLVAAVMLVPLMAWYGQVPDWRIVFVPFFALLAVVAAMGFGLWLSALTVAYRDFRHAVPFILQLGLYVSPVGFSSEVVPDAWRPAFSLNPMTGVIEGFRWSLLGAEQPLYLPGMAISIAVATAMLVSGLARFRSTEKSFADII